jgi:hypothetical protein
VSGKRSWWARRRLIGGVVVAVAIAFGAASTSGAASGDETVPDLSGSWTISSEFDNVPSSSPYYHGSDTVTFTLTAPDTYTVAVASGGATSNVVITGPSFTLWSCGASASGATYSQQDEAACPSTSGYWLEPWHFDFKGRHYTATGTFQEYAADGSTTDQQYGTFKAVGPKRTFCTVNSERATPVADIQRASVEDDSPVTFRGGDRFNWVEAVYLPCDKTAVVTWFVRTPDCQAPGGTSAWQIPPRWKRWHPYNKVSFDLGSRGIVSDGDGNEVMHFVIPKNLSFASVALYGNISLVIRNQQKNRITPEDANMDCRPASDRLTLSRVK